MKRLQVTNLTMNSNLAVYLGAYTGRIFRLAILNSNVWQTILSIIPYLKQMRISYKIYSDEYTFIRDTDSFHPDAILSVSDDINYYKALDKLVNTLKIDAIVVNLKNLLSFDCFEQNWYSVTIYNPSIAQTTYLYHTNVQTNIPYLKRLDDYSTIHVEWQPEIS